MTPGKSWLVLALVVGTCAAFAAPRSADRFQPLPRDESLQPLPPTNTGKIEYRGARSFKPEEFADPLAEQIRDINEKGLTKPRADDTAYYLAVFYRKQGFPKVEVDWEIRGSRLLLKIDEGRRTYLRRVTFSGNRAIDSKTLYEYMIGATEEGLLQPPPQFPLVEADMQTGVARLRGLYEAEGYMHADVDDAIITYSRDGTRADVSVKINEGQRFTVGEMTFIGNYVFKPDELRSAAVERFNAPYTTQQVNAIERNLKFFYLSRGYFQAKVDVTSDPAAAVRGRVPVKVTVQAHDMFRFNGVKVLPYEPRRLRPDFLPKRFAKLKGQVYDPAKLDEVRRELFRTGLFRNLRIESVAQPDDTVRFDLTVEEAKAKELGFSIGISSYEGFILGFRAGDRNFRGNGRPLTFNLDVSSRGQKGELLYVDPWLFESDFTLRSKLYVITREEEGYAKRDVGFRSDLSRKVTKNIDLTVFAELANVEITEAIIDREFLGPTSYQIATLGFTQTFDFRDNPVNPTRGVIISTGIDADTIAGEVAFGRATARLSYYRPVGNKMLLALGARGGLIYPLGDVPIDERYFNGGGTTVRSFAERQLGPKDSHGLPIGGQAFTVFNAELHFPLYKALQGAAFVDAGNLIGEFKNAGVDDMRYAVGLGLRYKLPIGPLRLDYGINPSPKEGESFGAFHFSFGFAF